MRMAWNVFCKTQWHVTFAQTRWAANDANYRHFTHLHAIAAASGLVYFVGNKEDIVLDNKCRKPLEFLIREDLILDFGNCGSCLFTWVLSSYISTKPPMTEEDLNPEPHLDGFNGNKNEDRESDWCSNSFTARPDLLFCRSQCRSADSILQSRLFQRIIVPFI